MRKSLASASYRSLFTLFVRRSHISLERRVRLYNAFVVPILLYNCGTWALTKAQVSSLSAFHRRHLRSILGVRWPEKISNRDLYLRTKQTDIVHHVNQSRLRLLGHCLRMSPESPPQQALELYNDTSPRGRLGRPKTTPGLRPRQDVGLSASALPTLREEAANRHEWRRRVTVI